MPGQSQVRQSSTPTPAAPAVTQAAPSGAQALQGNAAVQDRLRERQAPGRLSWQGALGEAVGGKLYDALSAQLTDDRLLGHANRAVDSAMNALKAQLAGQPVSDREAADLFLAHLDGSLRQIADAVVIQSGLSGEIRDIADANPRAIALAALAGAAAYVLSNQDLPLIEAKLGLGGGHRLVGGVDPGRTMQLALEQVRVGYRYDGNSVAAAFNVDRFRDGWSADGRIQYSPTPDTQMALSGSHSDRNGHQRSRLDLSYINRDLAANLGVERNEGREGNNAAIGASVSSRGGPNELNRSLSGTWRSDGSWEAAAGIGRTNGNESWSVEAFGGRDASGQENVGIRALYRLRF